MTKKESILKKEILKKMLHLYNLKGSRPTKAEFIAAGLSDHSIRKFFGGWNTAFELSVNLDDNFKKSESLIADKYRNIARSIHRKRVLEKHDIELLNNEFANAVKGLKLRPLTLNKSATKKYLERIKKQNQEEKRELTAVLSDTHFGLYVDSEEVGASNKYGWTEACRRVAFFAKEIAEYKLGHRVSTKKLNLAVLGDVLHGNIHNQKGTDSDLLVHQQNGALHILYHMISYLLNFFEEIEFYGLPGNHDDRTARREKGNRVNSQKYDSYVNPIYFALSLLFKGKVKFNIPKSQFFFINTIGGRIMGVHGDTVFSAIGNPGKSINTAALTHQIESFNAGEIKKGNSPIACVIGGHVHVKMEMSTQNGIEVVTNASLSGIDAYCNSISLNYSKPSQTIIESTKRFAKGDVRRVEFDKSVDEDSKLDKIIPIYDKELKSK